MEIIFEDSYGFRVPAWIFDKETLRDAFKLGLLELTGNCLKPKETDKIYSSLNNKIKETGNIATEPNVYENKEEITHNLRDIGSPAFTSNEVEKRRYRKKILMDIRGGECEKCGYDKNFAALDFHHPNKKNFNIGCALTEFTDRQFEEVLIPEVKTNTILLCSNCHRSEHHETCII